MPTPLPCSSCPSPAPIHSPQGPGSLAGHQARASQGPPGGQWGQSSQEGLPSRLPPAGHKDTVAQKCLRLWPPWPRTTAPRTPDAPRSLGLPQDLHIMGATLTHPPNFLSQQSFPVSSDPSHHSRPRRPCAHGGHGHHFLGWHRAGRLPPLPPFPTGQRQEADRAIGVTGSSPSRALGTGPWAGGTAWAPHLLLCPARQQGKHRAERTSTGSPSLRPCAVRAPGCLCGCTGLHPPPPSAVTQVALLETL